MKVVAFNGSPPYEGLPFPSLQVVDQELTADGIEFFGYGGDFGEVVHDGNFVMDGMVLSDGTPTPSLHEFAQVAAPFAIEVADVLTIRSRRPWFSPGRPRPTASRWPPASWTCPRWNPAHRWPWRVRRCPNCPTAQASCG